MPGDTGAVGEPGEVGETGPEGKATVAPSWDLGSRV